MGKQHSEFDLGIPLESLNVYRISLFVFPYAGVSILHIVIVIVLLRKELFSFMVSLWLF